MIIKKSLLMVICLNFALAIICPASEGASINMNEGRWEITTQMEMADIPFPMPAMTYTTCLTKENMVPKQTENNNCKITNQKIHGDTVDWTIICDSKQGKSTNTGTITYHGDSFKGVMHMQMPGMGSAKQNMTGKRVGSCN